MDMRLLFGGAGGFGGVRGWPLLVALLAGCGGTTAADVDGERPEGLPVRVIDAPAWDTLFLVGGVEEDTMLQNPSRIAADAGGVYLIDGYAGRLLRFDTAGALVWTFGRSGAGPGEFRNPRDLQVDRSGRAWVLDPQNSRLTVVDRAGSLVREIPLDEVGFSADDFVPLDDDGALLVTSDSRAPLVRLSAEGKVTGRDEFPWPSFQRVHPMARQLTVRMHAPSGRWAAAFQAGDGFWIMREADALTPRGWFVEDIPFARVRTERSGGMVYERLAPEAFAAWSLALSPTRLYVLFAGRTPNSRRVLDAFSTQDAAYLGSVLLPGSASAVDHRDGVLFVIYSDPYPTLAAWRPLDLDLP